MSELTCAVIVNYNGREMLARCLESLRSQCGRIVVVDNHSTDDSMRSIVPESEGLPVIETVYLDENIGFARACNLGATRSREPYVLFFNNDAIADADMLEKLETTFASYPAVGIAGPVVLEMRADANIVQTSALTIDRWGYPIDLSRGKTYGPAGDENVQPVFCASGCALAIRREVFSALGGFDEGMFMFVEDVDLCWRARLLGWTVVTVTDATCKHVGGGAAAYGETNAGYSTSQFRVMLRESNTWRMMTANLNAFNTCLYLLFLWPSFFLEWLAAGLLGRWWIVRAYGKALLSILHSLPDTLRKRRAVQRSRMVPDRDALTLRYRGNAKLFAVRAYAIPAER